MKIAKGQATRFSWGKVWGLNYKFPQSDTSVLYANLKEPHGEVSTSTEERIYYILSGEGEFIIAGKKFPVSPGDVVKVPVNTKFDYKPLGKSLEVLLYMEYWDSTKWENQS